MIIVVILEEQYKCLIHCHVLCLYNHLTEITKINMIEEFYFGSEV